MFVRKFARLIVGALVMMLAMVGAQVAAANAAPEVPADDTVAARTLYYDASRAAEFVDVVHRAAEIWNNSVRNVQLQRAQPGRPVNIVVYADNGWPRAQPTSLGNGRIWMGRQAVNQGHDPTRIAAHELGHILGLPDNRTGRCSDLMSGSSAPASCKNAQPSPQERAQVERNFSRGAVAPAMAARYAEDRDYTALANTAHAA
ncbi:hypothetical protein GCM10012275_57010 [Longimycelium tulufanense]|uniref:Extracellular small neutral protease n=1 Tax=Longimycelium tulufanense TaxID=907463 RepID=A0A8J3CI40_9PSEU|nr:snapalysin family zinc-dependent metalloprotease [Longimycelium tulufanense]GGM78973.1 hypothetical protein GCM10012275_57010 [Longimycelium tulufanense]